ncbi:MAG: Unknown protein [uncultured Sulfurovum sp.]|uniref:Lipoprotein n=1 Tax=uncultured Sulfurovum sp. TaxID=269237 RepID=A0A6S6UEX4_9BACT|nr:MAG: Unknown protein [uncultured Sulfurovum sp.]
MLRIFYACIILMSVGCVSNEATLPKGDRVGKFYLGLSELEVKKNMNCTVKYGEDVMWGADGLYHQNWEYPDCGIIFDMTSTEKNATKEIESITLVSPSTLKTDKGIGIGSTEKEVMNAYKERWSKGESREDLFVVDSIFGGILFRLKDGKVENVFVGAGAE